MSSRELFIVGHGESVGNIHHIVEGRSDIAGLTPHGKKQAYHLGTHLASKDIKLIVSGDLPRQVQTTEEIYQAIKDADVSADVRVIYTRLLREQGAGVNEGLHYDEGFVTGFDSGSALYKGQFVLEGAESLESLLDRTSTLKDNLLHFSESNVAIVGSPRVNSYFLNQFWESGKSGDDLLVLREQVNASYHHLKLDIHFNLDKNNSQLSVLAPGRAVLDYKRNKDGLSREEAKLIASQEPVMYRPFSLDACFNVENPMEPTSRSLKLSRPLDYQRKALKPRVLQDKYA